MRRNHVSALAVAAVLLATIATAPAQAQDESRTVADGGIHVDGWTGVIDAREASQGQVLANARLAQDGEALHVVTGPAVTYWNPANTATGNYTVTATFREAEFMALNNHPHPYGLVIAGNGLGTEEQSLLYCAAYGDGTFIVRGFGPEPFALNGPRKEAHDAVNEAAERGAPVTQEIAISVHDGRVECAINGTVVASYERDEVVAPGRLQSTDGIYGLRFGHNTEAVVTGLSVTQH